MPDPNCLLTILQLSDLHIGPIDPLSGDALMSPLTQRVFSNCSWLDGVLGHHARALDEVADFFWNALYKPDEPFLLVVSGDLTRVGDGIEFDNAAAFLGSTLLLPQGPIGLNQPTWIDFTIPGNHDNWPGAPVIWGNPHPHRANYFPIGSFPIVRDLYVSVR